MEEKSTVPDGQRERLLNSIQRLTGMALDRLEEGTRERMMDAKETRLMGSLALRSMRLWQEVLRDNRRDERGMEKTLNRLEKTLKEGLGKAAGGTASGP